MMPEHNEVVMVTLQTQDTSSKTLYLRDDERWVIVKLAVESPHFRKSPRLSQLLFYLSEQTLLGRTHLLTEHNIAVAVFERGPNFDPAADTIVRSHMVRLRQKLGQYAEGEGAAVAFQMSIPRGEYVVLFTRVALEIPTPPAA